MAWKSMQTSTSMRNLTGPRINVLVYLNKDWKEEYEAISNCGTGHDPVKKKILPYLTEWPSSAPQTFRTTDIQTH